MPVQNLATWPTQSQAIIAPMRGNVGIPKVPHSAQNGNKFQLFKNNRPEMERVNDSSEIVQTDPLGGVCTIIL